MKIVRTLLILCVFCFIILFDKQANACSMYKITVDGKTVVGCNHDTWYTTPKIWFATAKNSNEYGAAFTGARPTGANKTAPQSGMNEKGLAFSRLAAYHPK